MPGARPPKASAVFAIALGLLAHTPTYAFAQDVPETRAVEDARTLFSEGSASFQARRYSEAYTFLSRSLTLVDSPNTELLVARCLRELERRVAALTAFDRAAERARARATAGETRYQATAEAATTEGDRLRTQLGTVTIHIERSEGASVMVDGASVALSPEGSVTVVHDPGPVSVAVREANGAEHRQDVTVVAGTAVRMNFAPAVRAAPIAPIAPVAPVTSRGATPRAMAPNPPVAARAVPWTRPAAIASGVVSAMGLGVFIGFGLKSQGAFDTLNARCGPNQCGAAERALADEGKRDQAVAGVALGVGAAAAVAAAVFLLLNLTSPAPSPNVAWRPGATPPL